MQSTSEGRKDAGEAYVARWKSIYSTKWEKGHFLWKKKSPLMLLKCFHRKEEGRQMLRSRVTMVTVQGCSDGHRRGFRFPERAWQHSQPAQPTAKQLLGQRSGSPLPTNMSLVGAGIGLSRQ